MSRPTLWIIGAALFAFAAVLAAVSVFKRPIILAIGDSLTRGAGVEASDAYPAKLESRLRADGYRYEVINEGINGQTSAGALSKVGRWLSEEPDIVILETGVNDALEWCGSRSY